MIFFIGCTFKIESKFFNCSFLTFFTVPWIILIFPIIYVTSVLFLHDTPTSLLSRQEHEKAFDSLKFYRSCSHDKVFVEAVKVEFQILKEALENNNEEKFELKDFRENSSI